MLPQVSVQQTQVSFVLSSELRCHSSTSVVSDRIEVRALSWPSDLPQLERLDTGCFTDSVFKVQFAPHGYLLVERAISPSLLKQ